MADIVTALIRSEGQEIDAEHAVVSIDVMLEVNRIPAARIVVLDGDASKQDFAVSNTTFFEPGKEIEIKLKYEGQEFHPIFKGVVVKHSIKATQTTSYLVVDLRAAAYKLNGARKSTVFSQKQDSDIIKSIIGRAGINAGSIEATQPVHQQMVQYNATDWDFILSRADVNGLLMVVDEKGISAVKPDLSGKKTHTVEYGTGELYNFEMETDIRNQYQAVTGTAWDWETQTMSPPEKAQPFLLQQGEDNTAKFSEEFELVAESVLEKEEIKAWTDARMMKDRLALLRGRFKQAGDGKIKLMGVLEIKGTGGRFNGKTLITGVRHQVNEQGWLTDVQFGLSREWFSENKDIVATPAAGILPYVNGLQIGLVEAFQEDPRGMFRIKVKLPVAGEKAGSVWARLAAPDAGKNRGYFFIPEPGDEVVVGFFNDDPRQAVVLGSMYSKKNLPPEPFKIAEKNPDKGIVTIGELKLLFNDQEKTLEISTPTGNQLLMKDQEGLQLRDKNGNELIFNDQGITIKSAKDIRIEGKAIKIKGSKVDVN